MALEILNPGLSTTVQDLGRPGYFHLGIPNRRRMDRLALRAANLLVGNDEGAAASRRSSRSGIRFDRDALLAVTGRRTCRPRSTASNSRPGPRFR